jgi:hypothetical protein
VYNSIGRVTASKPVSEGSSPSAPANVGSDVKRYFDCPSRGCRFESDTHRKVFKLLIINDLKLKQNGALAQRIER